MTIKRFVSEHWRAEAGYWPSAPLVFGFDLYLGRKWRFFCVVVRFGRAWATLAHRNRATEA